MGNAVEVNSLGKMYRLFDKQSDRIRDLFGVDKLRFWDKEPKYREFWALRNVDLAIPRGERIGIIGRNGAGKSTLLKLIVGNLKPTEGTVSVHGKIQALLQIGTGFHPEFTGLENIRTALAYAGMDSKSIRLATDEIIEFSELEDYIHQPVKYYSAGMYSRLAFAVATSLVPDILVIDEVLGAGDAAFTSKCADRMKHLTQDTGATVLFVSHSMDSVLEICNRAILLERGEVTHDGTALEVSKIYNKKIREEEELRARAKEFRVSRKSMVQITMADESTQVLIMRFVCDKPHPKHVHFLYEAELKCEGKPVSFLHFGAPTDDDPTQFTHVIADKGADWGPAKKERGNLYRAYSDQDGVNCHAPFQMAIPVYLSAKNLEICINARPDTREKVYLEYFDGHAYHRLGEIGVGNTNFSFQMIENSPAQETEAPAAPEAGEAAAPEAEVAAAPEAEVAAAPEAEVAAAPETEVAAAPEAEASDTPEWKFRRDEHADEWEAVSDADDYDKLQKTNSVYGTQQLVIEKMDILNADGESSRVFVTGDAARFRIHIGVRRPVSSFIGVVCIMTRDGKAVTQVFCRSEELGIDKVDRPIVLDASFAPLRLGEGDYMVSVGLFQTCDFSRAAEEKSYCVADRALFFKVQQPFGIRKYLGTFLHACEWSAGEETSRFDGVDLKSGVDL